MATISAAASEGVVSTHTPGPWVAIHEPGHPIGADAQDNGGYRIDAPDDRVTQLAFVWVLNHRIPADGGPQKSGPLFGDVRAGANARLIAAAPDMLEALKLLRSLISEGGVPRYTVTPGAALNSFVEEVLDPAIAKATGTASRTEDPLRSAQRE